MSTKTTNASPQQGDIYLSFNGSTNDYVEVPSIPDHSLNQKTALTVAVWMRPDVLDFPISEGTGLEYVYWAGKGGPGQQEWAFRMYNSFTPVDGRSNRISFYLFNPGLGEGVGSYVQETVVPAEWIHVVAVVKRPSTSLYKNGVFKRCDVYDGTTAPGCTPHPLVITPRAGSAPLRLGTRDKNSFFEGGLTRFRMWNRVLNQQEISGLYATDTVPRDHLVAEFLLNANTGATAQDTSHKRHNGQIFGAKWVAQS